MFLSLLQGAAAGARAEAFVFSTRLTRLTRQLAVRDPDTALARAAAEVRDWAGGTRLAESLHRFIDDYGRQGMARGAVVVIMSDGWAQDDPAEVAAQMQRLRRLAYRIIWINPRKVAVDYQPLAGGMAAALPYCDAFVSGHSYTALSEVAAAIRSDRSQGSGPADHQPVHQAKDTVMQLERTFLRHRTDRDGLGNPDGLRTGGRMHPGSSDPGKDVRRRVPGRHEGEAGAGYHAVQRHVVCEERDAGARRATLQGKARETRGQGAAEATVTMQLSESGAATEASVNADLTLSGKAAAMGKSVIGSVTDQMLAVFTKNLQEMIKAPDAKGPGRDTGADAAPASAAPASAHRDRLIRPRRRRPLPPGRSPGPRPRPSRPHRRRPPPRPVGAGGTAGRHQP